MNLRRTITLTFCLCLVAYALTVEAQTVYSIDASKVADEIKQNHLKMVNPGPSGKEERTIQHQAWK